MVRTTDMRGEERDNHNALRADIDELRTQFIALLVKLDADTTLDDSDYESVLTPAALTSEDFEG